MALPETARHIFFARRTNGKKRKLIRAIMNPPPSRPATRSQGPLPMQLIDESPHISLERPGRLAPKWLEDFISGELCDYAPVVLDVGCANLSVRREAAAAAGGHYPDGTLPPIIRHELLLKGHQSLQGEPTRRADGRECNEVYSCVCQNCRYHFTFYIDRKKGTTCGLNHNNYKDPFHHLVFVISNNKAPQSINTKYYPYVGHSDYICSAKNCTFKLTVEISEPRLDQHFLDFLTDNDRIARRLQDAIQRDPDRFSDIANVKPNALLYLRIYLRDIVEGKKELNADGVEVERKIDQRNKKFYVQFGDGPDASELFTFLEFAEVGDGDNRSWKVPNPTITRPTRPGSQLAFYQDIKSEVETIIGKDSQNMKPNAAISFITNALDIGVYATSERNYAVYLGNDYNMLGLLPDMHEAFFWYAFGCQRQTDPSQEMAYFGALQRLARGRDNEELEMRVQSFDSMHTDQPLEQKVVETEDDEIRRATELSLKEVQPAAFYQSPNDDNVTAAYNYFGLSPDQRTDDEVLGKFESLCDSYPSQKSLYREKLLLLARHTGSKGLLDRAMDTMDLQEALSYLGVNIDTEPEFIFNIAQYACNSGEKDYALVAKALQIIGVERNNDPNFAQAAAIIMAERDPSYPVDNAPFIQMDLDAVSAKNEPVNLALPVGLQNIRNTCYLNSILQYLFTVKPIREIVLDYDKYGLEITPANLQSRRIDPGSTHLEEGEAYAGQQFVLELSSLFQELLGSNESALKPPQRLALAALKNPKQLETDGAKILAKDQDHSSLAFDMGGASGKQSPAPPLPARHAPAPPVPPRPENASSSPIVQPTPKVLVNAVSDVDNTDSSSTRSSQTLVNQADEGWQNVNQGRETTAGSDSTMEDLPALTQAGPEDKPEDKEPPPYSAVDPATLTVGDGGDVKMDGVVQETPSGGVQIVFDPPPVVEPTVEEKISRALNDSSVTGTDQQDVEEVMGNIISHLRAAVKATGEDEETGVQNDPVMDTFFWTSVTYNRSNGAENYNRQVAPNRWVTAYPDESGEVISLLQALDNSFQREFITQGTTRYERFTSILKLPPILHVHIQRTTRDGGKNNTAIDIPVALHLDRFMDSPVGSDLFNRRRRAWNLQERLRTLKGPNGEYAELEFPPTAIGQAAAYTNLIVEEYLQERKTQKNKKGKAAADKDEVLIDLTGDSDEDAIEQSAGVDGNDDNSDYYIINDDVKAILDENGISIASTDALDLKLEAAVTADVLDKKNSGSGGSTGSEANRRFLEEAFRMTPADVAGAWGIAADDGHEAAEVAAAAARAVAAGNDLVASRADYTESYREELRDMFADLADPANEYRLHAVVCHAGQTGKSGHYWVWVYDFAQRLWRRYNDSVVTEEPDADKVMKELSTQGEPYYLAYVRAADVESMVNIPKRRQSEAVPAAGLSLGVATAAAQTTSTSAQSDDHDTQMAAALRLPGPPPGPPPSHRAQPQQTQPQQGGGGGPLEAVQEVDEDEKAPPSEGGATEKPLLDIDDEDDEGWRMETEENVEEAVQGLPARAEQQ